VRVLLEAAVQSVESAVAAQRAGASRLELCVRLDIAGLTPPDRLVREVVAAVSIPVFVLVRPRVADFVYSPDERADMARQIDAAARAGAQGIVTGVLDGDRRIDVSATRHLVDGAGRLPVTFHRAFDETPDLIEALEDVIACGVSRVLTTGGAATASEGVNRLAQLVARGGDRIAILAGGGIRAHNVGAIVARTGVREVHARFEDEARTRALVDLL
jgi:copper homeostasis protein